MVNNQSLYITDEVIEQRMRDNGWIEGCDDDHATMKVLEHYGVTVDTEYNRSCGYYVYSESTVDGYTVYIATENDQSIDVSSDIYYYDSELYMALQDAIRDGYHTIYLEDMDYLPQATEDLYLELLERAEEDVIDELIDEGYIELIKVPTNTLQYIETMRQNIDASNELNVVEVKRANLEDTHFLAFYKAIISDIKRYNVYAHTVGITISQNMTGLTFTKTSEKNEEIK
jgi:hypothetical protein